MDKVDASESAVAEAFKLLVDKKPPKGYECIGLYIVDSDPRPLFKQGDDYYMMHRGHWEELDRVIGKRLANGRPPAQNPRRLSMPVWWTESEEQKVRHRAAEKGQPVAQYIRGKVLATGGENGAD